MIYNVALVPGIQQSKSVIHESESRPVMSNFLRPHGLYSPWNSPSQNTGVGSLSLLQGIFPTQGSNPGLSHYRQIFLPAEPQGKPKNTGVVSLSILQWIFLTQESKPGSPAFRVDSLPAELSGKPQLYIYPLFPFFFRLFSHIGHYRILSQVPCAIRGPFQNYFEWV